MLAPDVTSSLDELAEAFSTIKRVDGVCLRNHEYANRRPNP